MRGPGPEGDAHSRSASPLQEHLARLHAVVSLGLVGKPPVEQARHILEDARAVLAFDYAEVGERLPGGEYVPLCAVGVHGDEELRGIGVACGDADKPQLVFDTLHDPIGNAEGIVALGTRSMLFWPFAALGNRCMMTFAWQQPRTRFVSEDEIQYLEFLASVVSRLLEDLERQRTIAKRADTDLLTGVANRAAILEQLDRAVSAAKRDGSKLGLLYIDLNNFKKINDIHGHAAGDGTLRAIALRLQSVLRKHEMCGRVGGDEFCVVVSSVKDDDDLAAIARRIIEALTEPIVYGDMSVDASASIGIAVYPRDGATTDELLARADRAMYRAKREGAASFAYFEAEAPPERRPEPALHMEERAFRSQFMICYQPIVAARTGRPIAAEVLPRWLHPEGMRSPEAFLRAAREQNALPQLDELIARLVLDRAGELRLADITLHLNVSEPNENLIEQLPLHAVSLAVEVSEAQVAAQPYRYVAFAASCRSRGLRFGISDFAAHHLSLRALLELRPDFVKVRAGGDDARAESLTMIIEQAQRLSSSVIGEAVETTAQYQWLLANGVDAVQGYHICAPMAEQDFLTWLQRYRFAAAR